MSDAAPQTTAPRPEPIRFYGTTWLDRSRGYALRRAGLTLGAFAAAAAGAFVLRLAWQGLAIAEVGRLLDLLVVVAFAACSSLAFSRTWSGYVRRPDGTRDAAAEKSMHSIRLIGFIGVLLAYGFRSLIEAPGEKLHRVEYEQAVEQYERRRTARTGNPAAKRRAKGSKRKR
ncbi:hypothetical protein [Streptomyces gobiensis]|uniref:hypothetical protein n=1 Tax=Streptomyces gobiensis TaxID=2875706 RepID=UPI001E46762E|nr:hypothetical protein [Streptomyces gobiensis]UGY92881.1 hypothetical protein test1122_14980 [Streptomyces gobiensis]